MCFLKPHHLLTLLAISLIPINSFADSGAFTTTFESVPDQVDPTGTTTITDNSHSADLTGGTIDQIGVGDLYFSGVKSWMVAPAGEAVLPQTVAGNGTGIIILSEDATSVSVQGRNQSATTVAEVRLLDTSDVMIGAPTQLTNSAWTEINITRITGESLIRKIQLIVSSGPGNGMAALDDLSYQTIVASAPTGTSNNSSSSSGSTNIIVLQIMFALLLVMRLRKT